MDPYLLNLNSLTLLKLFSRFDCLSFWIHFVLHRRVVLQFSNDLEYETWVFSMNSWRRCIRRLEKFHQNIHEKRYSASTSFHIHLRYRNLEIMMFLCYFIIWPYAREFWWFGHASSFARNLSKLSLWARWKIWENWF